MNDELINRAENFLYKITIDMCKRQPERTSFMRVPVSNKEFATGASKRYLHELVTLVAQYAEEREAKAIDFGSWLTGKCDLHEKYTSACCGCQRASAQLSIVEDYKGYLARLKEKQ